MSYAPLSDDSGLQHAAGGGDRQHKRISSSAAALMNGEGSSSSNIGEQSSTTATTLSSISRGMVGGGGGKGKHRSSLSEPLTANNGDGIHNSSSTNGGSNINNDDAISSDPFCVFRDDLEKKIELVDESLAEYLRIIHHTDTSVNAHELKEARKRLKRNLKLAESTLKDVHVAVQLIDNDRDRFSHVDDGELYERRTLVQTSRDRMLRAKDEVQSEAVKAKLLADERAKAIRRAGPGNLGAQTDSERHNSDFVVDSQARTSLLMQHQEETLDELDVAVSRVGVMAETINEEIGQQNKMLDEMEEDLADAEEQLGMVMGKLAKFLKTKNKWQLGTIVGLFLTMIVLLFLVLYT